MSGGPLTNSLVLSFTEHLNSIFEIGPDFVSTQVGAFYRDVEKMTLEKGLVYPSYPASKALCAIGGILNNNSGGEKTLRYGKTIEYVREVDMVLRDGVTYTFKTHSGEDLEHVLRDQTLYGEIHRKLLHLIENNYDDIMAAKPNVPKNSAGYYLWEVYNRDTRTMNVQKLICGAQGTLGITTRTTLGLVPVANNVRTVVVFVNSVSDIPDVVHKVLPHKPESFELYDDHTFKIAMKFLPDIAKRMGGNMLSLGFQFLPEFGMVLTGGVPKVVLIAEFTGQSQKEVDEQAEAAYADLTELTKTRKGVHVRNIKTLKEAQKYWTFRRESFNLLRSKLRGLRTAPFIEDVVVRPDDFPTFLPEFEALLDKYKLVYTIAGHVGDGNLHVIPLMTFKDDASIEIIQKLSEEVYILIQKYGGSITGEHNDGLIRTPFLQYMFSPKMLELFQEVKNIFDPKTPKPQNP
jgi:FAD/FMN-containing dehydrogenase